MKNLHKWVFEFGFVAGARTGGCNRYGSVCVKSFLLAELAIVAIVPIVPEATI